MLLSGSFFSLFDSTLAFFQGNYTSLPLYKLIFVSFLGGFLSSFTPCVYPLIPITLSIFGINSHTSRPKAFLLSLSYVLGIALTYTILGIVASQTGSVFGQLSGNVYIISLSSVFLFLLLLFTLDIVHIPYLSSLQCKAQHFGGKGYFGAFLMGAASGLVAAPCVGPFLILLLGIASQTAHIFKGGMLLFAYSLGFGIIFIFLGTFSNLLQKLPRSGNWLCFIKYILASFVAAAIFFLLRPIAHQLYFSSLLLLTVLFVLGLTLGHLAHQISKVRASHILRTSGACMLGYVFFQLFSPTSNMTSSMMKDGIQQQSDHASLYWSSSIEEGLKKASEQNANIILVDIFAEWCAACKELETHTFSNSTVQSTLSKLPLVRIDFTSDENAQVDEITKKYKVLGLPTILFLRKDGSEIHNSRISGFQNAKEFLQNVESLMSRP
jgi:thioredoxin:protein disulfide reductase